MGLLVYRIELDGEDIAIDDWVRRAREIPLVPDIAVSPLPRGNRLVRYEMPYMR